MDIEKFRAEMKEFTMYSQMLANLANEKQAEAVEILSSPSDTGGVTRGQVCEISIRKIGSLLGDLCIVHNSMYRAIDMTPIFPDKE